MATTLMGKDMSRAETVTGIVKTLNFAPKGEIDGVMIEVGGDLVQINVPHEVDDHVRSLIGREVTVRTQPEPKVDDHPSGDHPVFKLAAFLDHAGGARDLAAQKRKPPSAGHAGPVEVSGIVVRLNYAKHDEANGVVLDTGDFVHLKPDGMKRAALKVGERVNAKGKGSPLSTGGHAVDADVCNGIQVAPKPHH